MIYPSATSATCLVCGQENKPWSKYFCSYKCRGEYASINPDHINSSLVIKKSYEKQKDEINKLNIYSKEETRALLLQNDYYKKFQGKSKNRTLIIENPALYKSIYEYTNELMKYGAVGISSGLGARIAFIVKYDYNIEMILCKCKSKIIFDYITRDFNLFCKKCLPGYPRKEFFQAKFGNNWEKEYEKDKIFRLAKSKGRCSLDWYKTKYGDLIGTEKYNKINTNKLNNNFSLRYSKISQDIFWAIVKNTNISLDECYFGENNGEWKVFLNKKERAIYQRHMYQLDFRYKNKNIEFDGNYFHNANNKDKDLLRDKILTERGFQILRISENDYYSNQDKIIESCVEFLNEN